MSLQDVVVVGAGIAGLTCARRLQRAGYQVTVLEKSRGLGGRLAARRLDGIPVDHGARFVQPQGALLAALTRHWLDCSWLVRWQPQVFRLDSTGQINPATLDGPLYVAPGGMSALGKAIATGLTVRRQQRVVSVAPSGAVWQIVSQRADTGDRLEHQARALVLAVPAPQSLPPD